jgi:hypothetical protein
MQVLDVFGIYLVRKRNEMDAAPRLITPFRTLRIRSGLNEFIAGTSQDPISRPGAR